MRKITALIIILIVSIVAIAGCSSSSESTVKSALSQLKHIDIQPFDLPQDWSVIAIEENPSIARVYLGKASEKNTISEAEWGVELNQSYEVVYRVSDDEVYAILTAKKYDEAIEWDEAVSDTIVPSYEAYESMTVNDQEVIYFSLNEEANPAIYYWLSKDKRYRYGFIPQPQQNQAFTIERVKETLEGIVGQ